MDLIPEILASVAEFEGIRHVIHAHPETGYEEHQTSALIADKLAEWGLEVHRGISGTGVVGVLHGYQSGRSIGLRADMDALNMQEQNDFAYRSRYAGKMHACGHDGHVAMLLAAARQLAFKPDFKGTVNFIFQPAEEGGSGAARMMEEGLFERFPCDAIFALHNWPGLPAGEFATRPGPIMASCNEFRITIYGKGSHAAIPQDGADPILTAAHIVCALQSVVTRNKRPIDSAVLSVTQIEAGTSFNIIPDTARIGGTVRTFSLEVLDMMEQRMQEIVLLTAQAHGCNADFSFLRQSMPTINDATQTAFACGIMRQVAGADKVNDAVEPTMGAEDFAYMLAKKPGCYAFIGNGAKPRSGNHVYGLHHPRYDFNDGIIPLGASYWVKLVTAFLDDAEQLSDANQPMLQSLDDG
ncbi:M20 family metallopeptidase [Methylobacillus arboreus]|uniref:M20 aminoacylase family protein n=1 Tax=Methylobacillus arboreus TaxID=755170 RepID=UPI001E4BAA75|nr:M20 aminoacylase family protein [Methylobacillus arboreus]MCB5190919.1 M20 family metallopeptidase [Methylobacillus arboreus]